MTVEFPKSISVELPTDRLVTPFSGDLPADKIQVFLESSYRGAINKNGTWYIEPAAGWKVDLVGLGGATYKVLHNLGWTNLSLSVSLTEAPGSFNIISHSPTEFIVETVEDGIPTPRDWVFTLTRVISQPAQP